jgi:hypothetical protein
MVDRVERVLKIILPDEAGRGRKASWIAGSKPGNAERRGRPKKFACGGGQKNQPPE